MRKRRAPVRVAVGTLCVLGVLATAPVPAGARAGDLDPSFGTGGTVNVNTGLARFLADGTPDPAFGTDGVSLTFFNGGHHNGLDAVVQADGHILVMDAHPSGDTKPGNFRLVRFTSGGALDPSYGTGGS